MLQEMQKLYDETTHMLKHVSLHGIRWMASKRRAIKALVHNYPALCFFLNDVALTSIRCQWSNTTPSQNFVNLRVNHLDADGTTTRLRVSRVLPAADDEGLSTPLLDKFLLVSLNARRPCTVVYGKNELVTLLLGARLEELEGGENPEWDMYCTLRTLKLLYFLLDVTNVLQKLSLSFQEDDASPMSVRSHITGALKELRDIGSEGGGNLKYFESHYDSENNVFPFCGVAIEDPEDGERFFQKDRQELVSAITIYLGERFGPLLNDPIMNAVCTICDKYTWPHVDSGQYTGLKQFQYCMHISSISLP